MDSDKTQDLGKICSSRGSLSETTTKKHTRASSYYRDPSQLLPCNKNSSSMAHRKKVLLKLIILGDSGCVANGSQRGGYAFGS